jgi:hypothetical protein
VNRLVYKSFADELEKVALLERLVRLGATDIPRTPRLLMRSRSPVELSALQDSVSNLGDRYLAKPVMRVLEPGLKRLPEGRVQNTARAGAQMLAKDPVGLAAWATIPVPGTLEAYYGGKKALEKGIDMAFPLKGK